MKIFVFIKRKKSQFILSTEMKYPEIQVF